MAGALAAGTLSSKRISVGSGSEFESGALSTGVESGDPPPPPQLTRKQARRIRVRNRLIAPRNKELTKNFWKLKQLRRIYKGSDLEKSSAGVIAIAEEAAANTLWTPSSRVRLADLVIRQVEFDAG